MAVSSVVKLYMPKINELINASHEALIKTAEDLHTEVKQATVVPRDTGTLQDENFTIDYSQAYKGKVSLVFAGRYARRLYYHPEYHFNRETYYEMEKGKMVKHEGNPNAKGKWMEDWTQEGRYAARVNKSYAKHLKEEIQNDIT